MRVLVLHPAAREQRIARDQRVDDGLVGITLLAVVVDDARWAALAIRAETGGILGVVTGIVHREGDRGVDAPALQVARGVHPGVEVLAAVPGRGVDEAGAGIVGDVVAGQHRHRELIAAAEAF